MNCMAKKKTAAILCRRFGTLTNAIRKGQGRLEAKTPRLTIGILGKVCSDGHHMNLNIGKSINFKYVKKRTP